MGYNDDLPVSTINSVANAILPLVMSLMPGSLLYVENKGGGFRRRTVPLNATFWAPFDAHDPLLVQEIVLGLALSPAQNLDLNVADGAKRCECDTRIFNWGHDSKRLFFALFAMLCRCSALWIERRGFISIPSRPQP